VSKIIMDEDEHAMEVIVPDDQLSLAIGKKGQNVRLASRLTTWRLDVRSESDAEDEARRARASLTAIPGVGDMTAELLYQSGFKSAHDLAAANEDSIAEVDGIGRSGRRRFWPRRASTWCSSMRKLRLQKPLRRKPLRQRPLLRKPLLRPPPRRLPRRRRRISRPPRRASDADPFVCRVRRSRAAGDVAPYDLR
jgi:hypothetical protein